MRRAEAVLVLALTGCSQTPETYPIPPQHQPIVAPERLASGDYVTAGDAEGKTFFVRDIGGSEGKFRWAGANPELKFLLRRTDGLKFQLEYGVHPHLLKEVGPLEMTVAINGRELTTIRDSIAGDKTFQKAVSPEWLKANADNIVTIRVHNPWLTPDKTYLGFIFIGAGFIE